MPTATPIRRLKPGEYVYSFIHFLTSSKAAQVLGTVVITYPGIFEIGNFSVSPVEYFEGYCDKDHAQGYGELEMQTKRMFVNIPAEGKPFSAYKHPGFLSISGFPNNSPITSPDAEISVYVPVMPPPGYKGAASALVRDLHVSEPIAAGTDALPKAVLYGTIRESDAMVTIALAGYFTTL